MQNGTTPRNASRGGPATPLLSVQNLGVRFGGIMALQDVSFQVQPQTICGVIGPNGAGKTTLFNCMSNLYVPTNGHVEFAGRHLGELKPYAVADLGLARTFQHTALFDSMSVRDNVAVGLHSVTRAGFWAGALGLPKSRREEAEVAERVEAILQRLSLANVGRRMAGELPFGTRKRVELARALVSDPRMVLLDEPAAGLNHAEVDELRSMIIDIRDRWGAAVVLVEHHMNLVMRISDQVVALNFGSKIADGVPGEVARNEQVISAYLGTGDAHRAQKDVAP